jgi:hypothetical protein
VNPALSPQCNKIILIEKGGARTDETQIAHQDAE